MDVFGLEPIVATLVISLVGVLLQVGLGVLKSENPFEAKKLLSSAIIAVFVSVAMVGPVLLGLPDDIADLPKFLIVSALVGTIAGIDTLVKNGGNAILAKARSK